MFPSRITGHSFSPEMPPRWMMPSTPATICSTAGISESSVRSTSSPSRAGASATRSERRKIGYRPRKVSRSERPMPPPAPVIRTRFIRFLLGVYSRLHQKSPLSINGSGNPPARSSFCNVGASKSAIPTMFRVAAIEQVESRKQLPPQAGRESVARRAAESQSVLGLAQWRCRRNIPSAGLSDDLHDFDFRALMPCARACGAPKRSALDTRCERFR